MNINKYISKHKRRIFHLLWLFIISALTIGKSWGQNPFIPKYDAVKRSERCFTVTWEENNQFGAVWWADKVDFSSDTLFNFVVYMGDRDGNGADGLAFVMHQDPRDTLTDPSQHVIIGGAGTWDLEAATGDDGGGLGFAMHESRVDPNTIPGPHGPGDDPENHKIQNSVAVELDTWNNNDVPDGDNGTDANGNNQATSPYFGWDHTAVIYNGDLYGGQQVITDANGNTGRILPLKPGYAFGTSKNPDGSPHHNIEDNRCYLFQIRWEVENDGTQSLELWADVYNGTTNTEGLQLIMTHNDDMINNVFGGDPIMRFGFTGSTGGSINEQTICLLGENLKPFAQDDYASILMNTTTAVNVEANDNDPDGDQLHVPIIMDPAENGTATIFDSLGVNYMRYTPNTGFVGLDTVGYVTCDVNSTKCYAKCDTAYVFIDVGCIPFDVDVTALSPNLVCSDSIPANGAASANVDATFIRGTLWYEGFEDLASQTTIDNGPSAWSTYETGSNCTSGNNMYVQNFEFRVKVVTNGDCEIVFETEEIDISNVSDVNISIDLKTSNATYENDDYIETFYVLDGGAETMFDINGHVDGTFGIKTARAVGLNGSTLKIVVRAKANHSDEEYYWDNIHITAIGAGIPDVTYNWYEGATPNGPIIYTGAVNNNLNDGTFTIVAIDNLTGCPSNPATITIDSAGTSIPGGFIEQLTPFTNCELPFDGSLGAGVIDGSDTLTNGYSFEWYHQEDPKIPSFIQRTGAIAQNLESREYTVIITDNSNGCDTTLSAEVPNSVAIPTITATKIADVFSCSDLNSGIGEANVAGDTLNYFFEWYVGTSIEARPPDYTNALVKTFPVGNYTVRAIDINTSCPSDAATITINDETALPILQINVDSEQISCDTLSPTGQLSGAVDESGVPTTSGYTFNWYRGPNNILPARPGYSGGPTADGLEAGAYRLVVIEDGTNCTSFIDTLVQDLTVAPPDIAISTTDVTSCADDNGTITIVVPGNPADFTYEVYQGNGIIKDSLFVTSASNTIQNLGVGNYTVIARDLITKCVTNPVYASINDAIVLPDANILSLDQISCDPENLTGQLTANMGFGTISDYTYEWFEDDFSNPLTSSSVDGEVISNLDSGNYVLRITNKTTSCQNIYYPAVNVAITLPVEQVTSNPSDYCGISANGQLIATVDGGLTEADGYTFIWENHLTSDTLPANTGTVNNVEPGDYILIVINNATSCASNPAPITVDDITVTPIPTIVATDNSSCDVANPNGQLEVSGTNESPAYTLADYSYGWYDNTGTLIGTSSGPNGEILNGLNSGTYELRIQNTTTSCDNSILSQINDINIKPIIDAVTQDPADNCVDPYNSGATVVSVNGGAPVPADYTFAWTNLDGGQSISTNGIAISDVNLSDEILPPGHYEVIALNGYNCPSDPLTFEILDISTDPTFSLSAYNNISCDPAIGVGSLLASRDDNSYTIATFEWFQNNINGILLTSTTPDDSILYNLSAGTFAVRVTDQSTGCTSIEYAAIQDAPASNPVIQNISIVNLTRCDIENGELGYRVIPFDTEPPLNINPRSYTFHLNGPSSYNQATAGTDNVNFPGLASGSWDAYVVDNFTHCQSSAITNSLTDAPEIIITTTINKKPTSCIGNDGEAMVTVESIDGVNKDPNGPGFDFSWYEGTDFTTLFVANLISSTNWAQEANNLGSTYYTVNVLDRNTQCQKDTTFFVPPDVTPVFLGVNSVDATQCDPGNGELTGTIDPATFGSGKNHADYDYILFEGLLADLSWSGPGNGEVKVIDGSTIADPINGLVDFGNDLKPGTYVIIAQEKDPLTKCFGEPFITEIELNFDFPAFAFIVTPDKSCVGGTGTGQLEETNLPSASINYSWYSGTNTSSPVISNANPTASNLYAGNYTLVAEITSGLPVINGLGCTQDSLVVVPKLLENIMLVTTITPNNNCAPYDGTIQISDVREHGISVGALPGDYTNFNIFDASLNPYIPSSGDGIAVPWSEIAPGRYYLQTQNDLTKCFSQILHVTINDLSQDPIISVALNNPDYACDTVLANGELEAFSTGGNQNPAEYTFEWFQGNIGDPTVSNLPVATNLTANSASQLYTVKVIDISGINEGCTSSKPYTLLHQPTTVYLLGSQLTVNPQTICGPNGSIAVDEIFENDPNIGTSSTAAPYTGLYSAQLLESNLSPSPSSYATFNAINGNFENGSGNPESIPAGTYYVRARDLSTGCNYGPLTQVIIRDESKNPIVSASLDSPDFACSGGTNTGILSPSVLGGTDNDTYPNFTINWYYKGTLTSPVTDNGSGTYEDRAIDLAAGIYTVEVTDMSGFDLNCITKRDYLVPAARHRLNISASGTDQTICIPNGTIQLDQVVEDGVNVVNPHLSWTAMLLKDASTPVTPSPSGTGFASNSDPFTGVQAGIYYIKGRDNLTQCYSNMHQVVLQDLSVDPVVNISLITPQYSLNPNPLSWTGALQASVTEIDGIVGTYDMNWHHGLGTANAITGETSTTIDSLNLGIYTFRASNTVTGCESSYYIYLPFVYLEPIFITAQKAKTICSPLDGGIEITDITLEGTTDQLSNYTFDFHNSSYASADLPDYTTIGNDTRTAYDNIDAGSYYILAEENWWKLESYPVQVQVIDSTTNPIIILDADSYRAVTSCDQDVFTDGALAIEVSEDNTNPNLVPPFNYSYAWYSGLASNPVDIIPGETSDNISGLPSGAYTVAVMNLANNCLAEKTFTIEDISTTPVVAATQAPNTNCLVEIANGVVTANVINSNKTYYYQWFEGTDPQASADYMGVTWTDRPVGHYTVIATDQDMGTCKSAPVTIKVLDATENPIILINEISPVTNCDPERPNGVLSATTQDGIDGHTFEWYRDGQLYATGPIASDLGLFEFQITVTDNVTQCHTSMITGPTELLSIVPPPEVDILNDRTSCISPDGSATASIDGNVVDYIFTYYNKFSGEELTNFYEDYTIYNLDTSTYQVIAKSRISGCISEPSEFAIANESYFPEIDVIAKPSNCQEPNGGVNVIISDMTRDFKVTWYGDNGFETQGKELVYIPAGKYSVDVEGTDGCITSTEAEVKGDVIIYNGVSANNDGLNEFFAIVCLEYYPENNVKIYNRAGLLVYEQDFYDMNSPEKRFTGTSNKGASIIGKELPIGTYFYVVDKNDGTKAKVGYLELNR